MIRFSDVRERCKRDKAKLDEGGWITRTLPLIGFPKGRGV